MFLKSEFEMNREQKNQRASGTSCKNELQIVDIRKVHIDAAIRILGVFSPFLRAAFRS